jgi:long-chain acyl-CoA synthetase
MNGDEVRTLPQLFLRSLNRWGPRIALRKKELGLWRDITWNEYAEKVRHVALGLMSMGFQKGERAALIGENSPEWVFTDLGIVCAGGVPVGIYTTNAAPQCEYIVSHSESRFYFAENEEQLDKALFFRERTPHLKKIIVWDMEGLHDFQDPMVISMERLLEMGRGLQAKEPSFFMQRVESVDSDDLAMLIYTSGTTGPPKGAMLTHGNLIYMSEAIAQVYPIHGQDDFLSFLPLCHIFEQLFTVFGNAYAVPRIWEKYYSAVMIRMSDATWFKRLVFKAALAVGLRHARLKLSDETISFPLRLANALGYFMVLRKLKERLGFDRVKIAISGAAPISPDVLVFFHAIGVNLMEGYGQTEGTGVTSVCRLNRVKLGTVGSPLPGCEVRIADDGEILVKSPGVFKGYFNSPQATAETLRDGWLHSGDVGELDDEGFLKITDRKKDLIITAGGKNIAPQFIENQLKFSPYINDAVVIGDRRRYLTALIVLDEENVVKYAQDEKIPFTTYESLTRNAEIIKLIDQEVEKVNREFSRVEQIKKFTILPKKLYEEDGEVTPTMKVKRKFINEAFGDLIEGMYE